MASMKPPLNPVPSKSKLKLTQSMDKSIQLDSLATTAEHSGLLPNPLLHKTSTIQIGEDGAARKGNPFQLSAIHLGKNDLLHAHYPHEECELVHPNKYHRIHRMKMSPKAQTHVAPAAPEQPPSPIYANPSDLLNVDSTFMLSRSNIHTTSDPLLKTKNSLTDIFRQCNSLHKQHMKFKK